MNLVGHVKQDGIMNDCLQRECLLLGEEEFCQKERERERERERDSVVSKKM